MSDLHDAIVVGAGPAGSTAARHLALHGARTLLLDRAKLPRCKPCAGWVTWRTFSAAGIDPNSYPGTLQPFHGVVLHARDGDDPLRTYYKTPASFGIVRSEFDALLVDRARDAGASIRDGCAVTSIRVADASGGPGGRSPLYEVSLHDGGAVRAPMLIGAGGHLCPVGRWLRGEVASAGVALCLEMEVRLGEEILRKATPHYGLPELYPEPDYHGYGWYVTKGPYLNIGIGRVGDGDGSGKKLRSSAARFLERLSHLGRLRDIDLPPLRGHAFQIGASPSCEARIGDGIVLVGDAGGYAEAPVGEGIRPAIESGERAGIHAARALAEGTCDRARLLGALAVPPTPIRRGPFPQLAQSFVPEAWLHRALDMVLQSERLRRSVVVERMFGFSEAVV